MPERKKIPYAKIIEACDYAGFELGMLENKIPSLAKQSDKSEIELTYKQLEKISDLTHYPYYGFYIQEKVKQPPALIADFRTVKNKKVEPSFWLKEQIRKCQARVDWFRDYSISEELGKVHFIGSFSIKNDPKKAAEIYYKKLKIDQIRGDSKQSGTYFKNLREALENIGILTEASGHFQGNTKAVFDVAEFRGFAISDKYAPLVFVNKVDSLNAQVFTLMHEFGHLLLGKSGISNPNLNVFTSENENNYEIWCNTFAAEILVPDDELKIHPSSKKDIEDLSYQFLVSQFVILQKCLQNKLIDKKKFNSYWALCLKEIKTKRQVSGGGNFYASAIDSMSKRFAYSLIDSANAGRTLIRDAYNLLGLKGSTFLEICDRLMGVKNA